MDSIGLYLSIIVTLTATCLMDMLIEAYRDQAVNYDPYRDSRSMLNSWLFTAVFHNEHASQYMTKLTPPGDDPRFLFETTPIL